MRSMLGFPNTGFSSVWFCFVLLHLKVWHLITVICLFSSCNIFSPGWWLILNVYKNVSLKWDFVASTFPSSYWAWRYFSGRWTHCKRWGPKSTDFVLWKPASNVQLKLICSLRFSGTSLLLTCYLQTDICLWLLTCHVFDTFLSMLTCLG